MPETITYTQLVSIIFKQMNKFRNNPRALLPILQQKSQQFEGNHYIYGANKNIKILTQEGARPIKQLISNLISSDKLPSFKWSYDLHCMANSRAKMLSKVQQYDNEKANINIHSLYDGLPDSFEVTGQISEHFLYGYYDPIDIITNLLIDDGHPDRENRLSLLNKQLNYIGIGIEQHPKYLFVVVLIFACQVYKNEEKVYSTNRRQHIPFQHHKSHDHSAVQMSSNVNNFSNQQMAGGHVINETHVENVQRVQNCQRCSIF